MFVYLNKNEIFRKSNILAIILHNDYLRELFKDTNCIMALDTAADYLGLSNGGYRLMHRYLLRN